VKGLAKSKSKVKVTRCDQRFTRHGSLRIRPNVFIAFYLQYLRSNWQRSNRSYCCIVW